MEEKFSDKLLSLATIWWFGPLSGAAIAIGQLSALPLNNFYIFFVSGFTNVVGVSLCLLYYLSNLQQISLNLILVLFTACLLLFSNTLLMYGAVKNKTHFLLSWLIIDSLSVLAAIVYLVVQWADLAEFRVPLVAASILSVYFVAVVSSYYHELKAPEELKKLKEKSVVLSITEKEDCEVKITEEETVLVTLDQEETLSLPSLPRPDEVIPIQVSSTSNSNYANPFTADVFQDEKPKAADVNMKVGADFTPFKKSTKLGDKTPAKMNVFLPGTGGDESDFDFSFNDPDFDSSLCAENHDNVD